MTPEQRQLEKVVRTENPELLKGLPGPKKEEILNFISRKVPGIASGEISQTTTITASSYPVPPAELLEGYNHAIPDGANRLFTLVEGQSRHRQYIEKSVVATQNSVTRLGQIFGFILVLILTAVGTYLGATGHDGLAGTVFATTIIGVATTFVLGRKAQVRSLDQKAPK
ncbi:MAG TPA: DUF2335 domain-containing protein [Chthoniobacteraceae bacterium]|nr:DUF2335 domain-containing protein [Chthoniobacteraceae bacterium]